MKNEYRFIRKYLPFILELILVGGVFAVVLLLIIYPSFGTVVILNFAFLLIVYCVLRMTFVYILRKNVYIMSRDLKKNFDEDEMISVSSGLSQILAPFYATLHDLKNELKKTEENRRVIMAVIDSIAANMDFAKVLEDLMPKLTQATGSSCSAFYGLNGSTSKLEIKHSVGFGKNIYSEFDLSLGEGYIGSAASANETTVITDIPEDTVYTIRTFIGKIKPRNLMVTPVTNNDQLIGILVFASVGEYTSDELEMMEMIKFYVGIAATNGQAYDKTKRLGNELKFQNKLIQDLNEELEKKVENRSFYLNNIIDSIADYAIYAMDTNGVIMTWSKGAQLLTGFSSREIMGRHVENIYSPEEREAVHERIKSVLAEGKYTESGLRQRKDGTQYYYELMLFCIYNDRGEIIGISSITKDVTEMRKTESALWFEKTAMRILIDTNPKALAITDEEGNILIYNHNAELLLEQEMLEGRGLHNSFEESGEVLSEIKRLSADTRNSEGFFKLRGDDIILRVRLSALFNEETSSKRIYAELARDSATH